MKNIIIKNSERFKSVLLTVNLLLPLEADKNSKNTLLAMVLKKSNEMYKNEKELDRALAALYDTTMDINVEKLDNLFNIQLEVEFLNKKYISKQDLEKIKEIIFNIICKPNIINGKFEDIVFEREKSSLIQKISEERDDKRKYALECLKQDMFFGTAYGVPTFGTIDMVEQITNEELAKHYSYVVDTAQIMVTAVGNLDGMLDFPQEILKMLCEKCGKHIATNVKDVEEKTLIMKERTENQDINQSVLCIGLKIEELAKEDTYVLALYNAILGGTPASKLFQNVREKESLAYFAKSVYNRMKQVIYMYAGVDPLNNEKAKNVMLEQLDIISDGMISDEEFYAAKQSLIAAYIEMQDSKMQISRNVLSNEVYFGYDVELEEIIQRIESLTLEDIFSISKKIKASNVFLLGGKTNV